MASGREKVKRWNCINWNNRRKIYRKDKDVYAVFVDLEKAFGRVHWKKLHWKKPKKINMRIKVNPSSK